MRPRRFVLLLVVVCLAGAPATAVQAGTFAALAVGIEPVAVLVSVNLDDGGNATWQVRYVIALDDENATAAFDAFRSDVATDPDTYRERFAERMRETVGSAEEATGRQMTAHSFTVETAVDPFTQDQGFVTYTFVWDGFAEREGARLRTGDVLAGLYLDANTTLTIAWPTGFEPTMLRPQPDETLPTEVTWVGERNFGPGEPRVILARVSDPPATTASSDLTTVDAVPAAIGVATLLAVLVAAALWRRSYRPPDGDVPLLTNEERVLQLLEARDGRMKQQDIVEATGWSEMKTSQVIRGMREDGTVEVFRLGRENVVSLPDNNPT